MRLQRLAGPALTGLLLLGGVSAVNAQDVSSANLERFAQAVQSIQEIERQTQSRMEEAIESQGLTIERFNLIARSLQDPAQQPRPELSREEAQNFEKALSEISGIRDGAQQEMQAAVQQEGLNVREFNAISEAVQQDPALRTQVLELIQQP